MITRSKRLIPDLLTIAPEDIDLSDIIEASAAIVRFAGHLDIPWTDATHGVLCYEMAKVKFPGDAKLHRQCLAHDWHEAYMGDWPGPATNALRRLCPPAHEAIELLKRRIDQAIGSRFEIVFDYDRRVKLIDDAAMVSEMMDGLLSPQESQIWSTTWDWMYGHLGRESITLGKSWPSQKWDGNGSYQLADACKELGIE